MTGGKIKFLRFCQLINGYLKNAIAQFDEICPSFELNLMIIMTTFNLTILWIFFVQYECRFHYELTFA